MRTPRESLNKAFLKVKPNREQIESFKNALRVLLSGIGRAESEEHQKNLLITFLRSTHYHEDHFVNTKDRIDLVIHNGIDAKSTAGVLFEVKRATNSSEMPTALSLNTKALQELLLYYLRERIQLKNLDLKHLVVTNIKDWFIFDANVFEKAFAQDKQLVRRFEAFELDTGKDTAYFYSEIAKPAIEAHVDRLEFSFFALPDIEPLLTQKLGSSDRALIPLYKILSSEHLLKKPFVNDSNSLNKTFYTEVLHIVGLEEVRDGSKKLIKRNETQNRNSGSLLESIILIFRTRGKLYQLKNPKLYGDTEEEQEQNVALELSLTWINRLLFLKLLEAQLVKYHSNDKAFAFLDTSHVQTFNDLEALFFQVLAVRVPERDEGVQETFKNVPYLNSSLFEPTALEHEALSISSLNDNLNLPLYGSTVLKDLKGKRRAGDVHTLPYLLEFLDCYDFSSESSEDIQEGNKALISANVLGLIFEKINGYKDGSFYTPSFVTMFMCRQSITDTVIKRFNSAKHWKCKSLVELYNNIEDKREANEMIDSLRICDPAVGSGHFLVSALNELIYIKAQLGLLFDKKGKSLKDYDLDLINDELVITDQDGQFYSYQPASRESLRVQETLFREKQTIIENCLFGVDINPNSVKICRLRLWIELLKNTYYNDRNELETLPNIDINIKVGDSLISKFDTASHLVAALKKSKVNVAEYKAAVIRYKNANNKAEKRDLEAVIGQLKSDFRTEILATDPRYIKVRKLEMAFAALTGQQTLFELEAAKAKEHKAEIEKVAAALASAQLVIKAIDGNRVFKEAFEWLFEFPEILDSNGEFIGFDVIIGNPPYIDSEAMVKNGLIEQREYIASNYKFAKGNWDIYIAFFERGLTLLKTDAALIYITPDKWIAKPFGQSLREQTLPNLKSITQVGRDVFENANVDSIITHFSTIVTKTLSAGRLANSVYQSTNVVEKADIGAPFAFDYLFSSQLSLLKLVERADGKLEDYLACENACATSDCYRLKDLIQEFPGGSLKPFYKVANTGTLSKYFPRWGSQQMTYLGNKYLRPVVKRTEFSKTFQNSYLAKTQLPKLIVKGLTKMDVTLDLDAEFIPGKTTLILASKNRKRLKLIAGVLNSALVIKYIKEKYSSASYNGGISFTKDMINRFPFPKVSSNYKQRIVACVNKVLAHPADLDTVQKEIDAITFHLYGLSYQEASGFYDGGPNFKKSEYDALA